MLFQRWRSQLATAGMPTSSSASSGTSHQLLQDIRAFGRIPKEVRGDSAAQVQERHLAERLRKAKQAGLVSAAQESELAEVKGSSEAQLQERSLAQKLRKAKQAGRLSAAQESELAELKASELGGLAEAEAPPDPLDPFADDAANRFEQDLLMFSNGIRPRELQRRLRRYQRYVGDPALQSRPEVQKYREQVQLTCASAAGRASYVAGQDIQGDALRTFACTPEACGPLTCQLCDADFLYEADFGVHKDTHHGGENEYRKRVLYLMDDVGCRPITAQEKRVMVQNFSHFQQFSRPGAKGNTFARASEVHLRRKPSAACSRSDGHYSLTASTEEPTCGAFEPVAGGASQPALLRHGDVHYLQAPKRVHGGGGVGKTRTLSMVVQPLAETYFGPEGYCATAQSNHAAQNLGSRGRTLHAANGLLMADSLQTARLRCNAQTQKKLDCLAGDLGVDIIDELGCVPGDLLHADALRKTYGRCLRHNLDATKYMKPNETWGRMPVKILSGDFYQLPPVPATASLLASPSSRSYEHQQGRKLLSDMEYVLDFVNMQRFQDPLLVHILEAMRTPGGQKISEEAWQALKATAIGSAGADARSGASQPVAIGSAGADARLKDARGWYECAYEWRIVSYAMHAHARLNAKAAAKILLHAQGSFRRDAGVAQHRHLRQVPRHPTGLRGHGNDSHRKLPPASHCERHASGGRGHRSASQGAARARPRQHRLTRMRSSALHA